MAPRWLKSKKFGSKLGKAFLESLNSIQKTASRSDNRGAKPPLGSSAIHWASRNEAKILSRSLQFVNEAMKLFEVTTSSASCSGFFSDGTLVPELSATEATTRVPFLNREVWFFSVGLNPFSKLNSCDNHSTTDCECQPPTCNSSKLDWSHSGNDVPWKRVGFRLSSRGTNLIKSC